MLMDSMMYRLKIREEFKSIIAAGLTVEIDGEKYTLNPNTIESFIHYINKGVNVLYHSDGNVCREYTNDEISRITDAYFDKYKNIKAEMDNLLLELYHMDHFAYEKVSLTEILKMKGLI